MIELKNWCRNIYRKAIHDGVLVKQPCAVCGTKRNIEGHHKDHTKPLEVKWLCKVHHARIQGLANVKTGHIYTLATPEICSKAGRISGKRNVETGHIYRVSEMNRGRKHSDESKKKMSEALKTAWMRRKAK